MEQNITTILSQKGRRVVTITPDSTLQEAARLMSRERIGSLVITGGDNEIHGILSERDVMHHFAETDGEVRTIPVNQVMTPREKMIVAQPTDTVEQLMAVMTRNQVRHIPILSTEPPFRLEGIISIGDLVKSRLTDTHAENRFLHDYISGHYPR